MSIVLPEWLVINSINLGVHNRKAEDILPLLGVEADGENRRIPSMAGQRGYLWETDQLVESIRVKIRGDIDEDGVPLAPSARAGLATLIASLKASIYTGSTAVSHPAEIHLADSSVLTADVQVPKFSPVSTGPLTAVVLLQVVVLDGAFT